jgi:hypothetical protein
MKQFTTPLQPDTPTTHFGICPRCKEEQFLSVPTLEYGMICIYCLYDLYPPNGIPRPIDQIPTDHQEPGEETNSCFSA